MTEKPNRNPDWASPNNDEPTLYRTDGYPSGEDFPVPGSMHNWQFDTFGQWIRYFEARMDRYESVGEAFDANEFAEVSPPVTDPMYPYFVQPRRSRTIPFMETGGFGHEYDLDLGFDADDGTPVAKKMAVNSKYIVYVNDDSDIEVRYAKDLSAVVTFSIAGLVSLGSIELAVDGFRVAVAFDSKIRVWDIDDSVAPATATQDTGFAVAGTFTYDGGADSINGIRFLGVSLIMWGDPADGTGALTAAANFAALAEDGLLGAQVNLNGTVSSSVTKLSVGRGKIAAYNGIDLMVYDSALSRLWYLDVSSWNTVSDIACGDAFVAIAGNKTTAGDNKIEVYQGDVDNGNAVSTVNDMTWIFDAGATQGNWRCVFDDLDRLWFSLHDAVAGTEPTRLGVIDIVYGASNDLRISHLFEIPFSEGGPEIFDINLEGLFVYLDQSGVGVNERIRRYSMGRGDGWWVATKKRNGADIYDMVPVRLR